MKRSFVGLVILASFHVCWSGERGVVMVEQKEETPRLLTGNLRVDFFGQAEMRQLPQVDEQFNHDAAVHKSPFVAAGLSLAIPGAGEFYTERYWEAAAFLAADVAAWVLAYSYDKKGDRKTDFFQNYANEHWSPVRYAEWTRDNASQINPNVTGQYAVINADNSVNWSELNRLERDLGKWYSHTLPPYGEQQYYELIGKYQQFYQGWDDGDPNLLTYESITQRLGSGYSNFTYYSGERGKANSYYNTASTWVTVAIVNHVVSAAYAALSAGWYNKAHASMGLQLVPVGDGFAQVPVVRLSYDL